LVDSALFSSASDEWETPQWLFDKLDQQFHFTFDAAATPANRKCVSFSSDSLNQDWKGQMVWLNPPYSHIEEFIKKAYNETRTMGTTAVCLIPSRTDTKWWHEFVFQATTIYFIRGRLYFSGAKNSAPFPSCVVVFNGKAPRFESTRSPNIGIIRKVKS
jgi:phage N-6-adenine-methyltransferase